MANNIHITQTEHGDLIIHPLRVKRGAALLAALRAVNEADDGFARALQAEQEAALPMQEREAL